MDPNDGEIPLDEDHEISTTLDIYTACKLGRLHRVATLIDLEGFPINKPDEYNRTGIEY
jgi:hypothetical protein